MWNKANRTSFYSYLSSGVVPGTIKGRSEKGLPSEITHLRSLIESFNPEKLRLLNSLFTSTRWLTAGNVYKLGPITAPSTLEFSPHMVNSALSFYVKDFWRHLGFERPVVTKEVLQFAEFHFTSKSGPNGHALLTSLDDCEALPASLIDSIRELAGDKLADSILLLKSNLPFLRTFIPRKNPKPKFRRLAFFPDKEDKTRIVAILDYFSQAALKPLHKELFRILRKIENDFTFNQNEGRTFLSQPANHYYSVDLSNATDRFPLDIIELVLSWRFPTSQIKAWKDIMVGYDFDLPKKSGGSTMDLPRPRSGKVKYEVGNPMGAYSSWPSFTIAHHFLVYVSHRLAGVPISNQYILLGDDLVISNDDVADKYMQLLDVLGVSYSVQKTHKSEKFYEFAKKLTFYHNDISGVALSSFQDGSRYNLVIQGLIDAFGLPTLIPFGPPSSTKTKIISYFDLFMNTVMCLPSRFRKKLLLKATDYVVLAQAKRDSYGSGSLINLARHLLIPSPLSDFRQFLETVTKGAIMSKIERVLKDLKFSNFGSELSRQIESMHGVDSLSEYDRNVNLEIVPQFKVFLNLLDVRATEAQVLREKIFRNELLLSDTLTWGLLDNKVFSQRRSEQRSMLAPATHKLISAHINLAVQKWNAFVFSEPMTAVLRDATMLGSFSALLLETKVSDYMKPFVSTMRDLNGGLDQVDLITENPLGMDMLLLKACDYILYNRPPPSSHVQSDKTALRRGVSML